MSFEFGTPLAQCEGREFAKWSEQWKRKKIRSPCPFGRTPFGFNPIFLRIPFAASVLWSPTWAIAAYFALGAVVLLSRVLFPKAKSAAPVVETQVESANEERELAKAA